MNARGFAIALAMTQILLAPGAAHAAAWGSVGMIEAVRGAASDDDVKVERAGEGRRAIGPSRSALQRRSPDHPAAARARLRQCERREELLDQPHQGHHGRLERP